MLIGPGGLEKLKNSKVAVFGVGGVGSYTVEALARAGVGHLVLVDFDDVDITNINRQLHALDNTVGRAKVELMAGRVKLINPEIKVQAVKEFYTPENGEQLLAGDLHYVVDAIDNVTGKLDLIKRCVEKGIPVASSMGAGNKLDPTAFQVADISETSVCPLAKVVRKGLKKAGICRGVKVVYSTEPPVKPRLAEEHTAKLPPGSISFVPAAAGLILASIVVRDLTL
uniref:tRNA threonylcarbamoyladenosine dehydratase n=1 Tax=Desulforadius tongensis TaxID=1216062 RepID=UPI001957E414|nr:tRNA threonylcarbamoyladenosine dehydratase [Desulforadius tongensis]